MPQQRQCPRCLTSYSQGEAFCLQDGSPLIDRPKDGRDDPRVGTIIAGRFELQERIRAGGMGAVYRATHRILDREFAIKLLHRDLLNDQTALQRFHREARATSAVAHPHIVSLYDYGQTDDGEPYLAMEFVSGITLFDLAAGRPGRRLPPSQAADVVLQIAQALAHAHGCGVIHRDIKPENVLLTSKDDQPDWVKLLDFGVARIVGLPPLTRAGDDNPGTPAFMAPELFSIGAEVGPPIDLYALGILLHDVLAGSPPFSGAFGDLMQAHLSAPPERLSVRCKGTLIPPELDALCAALLDKDPARRPTAAQAAARLEAIRPRLPPRSVRSAILAQTYILAAHERGRALREAETLLLPRSMPTVVLATVLREVDRAEDELDRASGQLAAQAQDLLDRLFVRLRLSVPLLLASLQSRLAECAQTEEELGVEMALLRERAEEAQLKAATLRSELHPRILALSQALQGRPLLDSAQRSGAPSIASAQRDQERSRAPSIDPTGIVLDGRTISDAVAPDSASLEALEREYAACEPGPDLSAAQARCQTKLQELRAEIHRLRRQVAEHLLLQAAEAEPEQQTLAAGLRRTLDQFDDASATLALLLRRMPR